MPYTGADWQLLERPGEGQSICFDLRVVVALSDGRNLQLTEQGFLTCFQGKLRAWRNHCPHAGSPLDWIPGQFYSDNGDALVCHTHGARFDPLTGTCLSGPCPRGLFPLEIKEDESGLYVPTQVGSCL